MRLSTRKNLRLGCGIIFSVLGIALGVYAFDASTGYKVDANSFTGVAFDGGYSCSKVNNTLPIAVFVPTKTANEWAAFISNRPMAIFVGDGNGICGQGGPGMSQGACAQGDPSGFRSCAHDGYERYCGDVCDGINTQGPILCSYYCS